MDDHDIEELAKTAYDAYGESTGRKNYLGLPMPTWEDLPEGIRKAWIAASAAIVRKYKEIVLDNTASFSIPIKSIPTFRGIDVSDDNAANAAICSDDHSGTRFAGIERAFGYLKGK